MNRILFYSKKKERKRKRKEEEEEGIKKPQGFLATDTTQGAHPAEQQALAQLFSSGLQLPSPVAPSQRGLRALPSAPFSLPPPMGLVHEAPLPGALLPTTSSLPTPLGSHPLQDQLLSTLTSLFLSRFYGI